MQRWSRLNERQLALLTRIAAGDDPVTSDTPELALSARALKERGLVTMLKAGGKKWQAATTAAGTFYLEHGHHPDLPAKRPRAVVGAAVPTESTNEGTAAPTTEESGQGVTSAGVVYRRPLGDLVVRLCGEFGGQGGFVGV
ncbi:hypothetical protein VSR01_17985 [Actinacidiphila sp. DG2A-62]|uniref:hypothetical protein n=1 Tax=Actinacidiphila sp. DG2A-62 TaxID=3108821 RepID=UPI002DB5A779|nr:hypothetical protein [Actinacidiphila sp. DG2A-62]MEC3995327.1 hypothetical protein [Actinacidiphila sp. DG2A-62]